MTRGVLGGGDVSQYQFYGDLQAQSKVDVVRVAFSVSSECSCTHVV
jgi:hypothetical protein